MSTAHQLARTILDGFHAMFADFQRVTLGAKARFEQANWQGVQKAQAARLDIYKSEITALIPILDQLSDHKLQDLALWRDTKAQYVNLLGSHCNHEIAETFYNSVFCKVFQHQHITDEQAFVVSSQIAPSGVNDLPIYHTYYPRSGAKALILEILQDYSFAVPYQDLERDVANIARQVYQQIVPYSQAVSESAHVDVMTSVFYRNKGAYLVGRICGIGQHPIPFVLPIVHGNNGSLLIDTLISDADEVSIIFSFTRSYFMVASPDPSQIVSFLHSLIPQKKQHELYASIGFRKHSKTGFYRDFIAHLQSSDDQFVVAPGIRGMVMAVFTLPSYDIVFKLIKDHFVPPKEVTREIVMEKYKLVVHHDRVGRMADTQEFNGFRLPRARFPEALLNELLEQAPSQIKVSGDEVIIEHIYTERRMTPLNLYLRSASDTQIIDVMDEYGNAIKQLAAANIFPGDMLLKNFGVTRHGRVVFYDYDELCHITECNFRKIPQPQTEEQELASQPWYTVADEDIFPEEFRLFFSGNPKAREAFDRLHGELYNAEYWQGLKDSIEAGEIVDVFPYRRNQRFTHQALDT